jgi:gliding motility-associated lipoprotein GldD
MKNEKLIMKNEMRASGLGKFNLGSRLPLIFILHCSFLVLLTGCGEEEVSLPKKHGFPRMDIPASTDYKLIQSPTCPFEFEAPVGAEIARDLPDSCWLDLYFPKYDLTWHISHRDTRQTGRTTDFHFEEHRKLIYKHSQKATEIRPFDQALGSGRLTGHELFGEVGTPYYLFLRDSSNTQVASLSFYFQTALENDSLAPLIGYMKDQMDHAVETFRWE